jgi:hypothetical protein
MKAPNSKLQHPEKLRCSTSNIGRGHLKFEDWSLALLWSLDVGAWSF